ncbi:hypothetical protein U9M48_030030 [Paspalum notatum var. saurae]|uniref:Pentatricopeptide repeat-containing protein n=1 Tax=Paspalum notatum var. saurae TaxID=547442 RepID=A0AAQ3X3C0_PASNO
MEELDPGLRAHGVLNLSKPSSLGQRKWSMEALLWPTQYEASPWNGKCAQPSKDSSSSRDVARVTTATDSRRAAPLATAMLWRTRRWSLATRAFSTAPTPAPAARTTVPLAHLAPLPASLPESGYTVAPPVQPWPRRLTPRSLSRLLLRAPTPDAAVLALRHALFHAAPPLPPSLPVFAAVLSRLSRSDAGADAAARFLPPVLSLLRAARLPTFSDRPFLPLLRALRPLPSLRLFLSLPSFNSRPSVRSFNALLHSLVSARRLRLAAALFRASQTKLYITPNLVSCNILLKGLVGVGDLDAALKVLDEMTGWGIVPDVVTYTTVLTAYCAKGDLEGAQKLFDDIIASGRRPDVTMYTVLIDGYCLRGKLQDAARIMDEMEAAGVRPNEVTFSVLIEACCKEGKSVEARDLMREMLGAGYVPDTPLCAKVVDVLCQDGKAGEAYEMWRWMLKKNVPPDNAVASTLIYWLCKNGMVQEARKLFDELERGVVPSLLAYNSLILGLCENGELQEAGKVWDDMVGRRYEPSAMTYEALIKGFCKIGKSNEGAALFKEMMAKGLPPSKFLYQALVASISEPSHDGALCTIVEAAAFSGRGFWDGESWELVIRKVVQGLSGGRSSVLQMSGIVSINHHAVPIMTNFRRTFSPSMEEENMNDCRGKGCKTDAICHSKESAEVKWAILLVRLCIEMEMGVHDIRDVVDLPSRGEEFIRKDGELFRVVEVEPVSNGRDYVHDEEEPRSNIRSGKPGAGKRAPKVGGDSGPVETDRCDAKAIEA